MSFYSHLGRRLLSVSYTHLIVGYLYKRGIEKNDMGYACAVGMVLLVIALVINIVQLVCNGTFKREED